ncbi:hypothetical protein IIA29_10170 [candidate division KSB1 bacterium]|nr:hypothetical protein [candidate division KSB1 bacterium]
MDKREETELRRDVLENGKKISGLKMAVYGDNNGKRGLIRRVDGVERNIAMVLKQNWLIIVALVGKILQEVFFK